jgi:protein tyrosine/serine phosphatase
VIDLRGDTPGAPWEAAERKFCRENSIRYVKMTIGPTQLTDDQLKQFIEIATDPKCQPVLVHCELGKSRTGVMVAAYRIIVQGWRYENALAEAQRLHKHMNPGYAAYLKGLAEGKGWRAGGEPSGL